MVGCAALKNILTILMKRKLKMARKTTKHVVWIIQGWDGSKKIYEAEVNVNKLGPNQIKSLLRALTAKAGLTFDEILGAHLKRRTVGSTEHLHVNDDPEHHTLMCGSNPHFVARVKKL
jgi:hypothetical protein